jgi:hypothetical protein
MAGYHRVEDARRVWLEADGDELISFCYLKFQEVHRAELRRAGAEHTIFRLPLAQRTEVLANVRAAAAAQPDVRDPAEFLSALATCIGSPAEQLIAAPDPLVRALAMLDRRVGKRRLSKVAFATEHRWVQQLHQLRCESEAVWPQV